MVPGKYPYSTVILYQKYCTVRSTVRLCTPPVDSLSDDPSAWALESLVASPECEPGLEVPIDCEEDDLPHLPGWVRKSMVKYVSPTGLWMDTPTRSVATEWEVRLKKKIFVSPRRERGLASECRGGSGHENEYMIINEFEWPVYVAR